MIDFDFHRSS